MATRFYFPASTSADINPPMMGWDDTSEASRFKLVATKGSSSITEGTRIGPWTPGDYALDRQYVSEQIAAQSITGTVKMQILAREYEIYDNATIALRIWVINNDGSIARGILLPLSVYGPATELYDERYRNKTGADGDMLSAVSALAGDRIVVEIGYVDAAGMMPEASAKWGENASDLPENETETADGAGWIEFSANISFQTTQTITGAGGIASGEEVSEGASVSRQVIEQGDTNAAMPTTRRTIEVVRVGSINRVVDYPGKQVVRLRDLSGLYDGDKIKGLEEAGAALARYRRAQELRIEDANQLAQALQHVQGSLTDLFDRMKGRRLSRINIEVWDQISGGYLGPFTTDANGTLVLPTDRKFVEVLQWEIAGGGYSDVFNGERAAGTPGLYFYFPCNEGSGNDVASFPGVSGQLIDMNEMDTPWEWYKSGFFNRPALRVTEDGEGKVSPLIMFGGSIQGISTTQLLWYCSDHTEDRILVRIGDMRTALGGFAGIPFATIEVSGGKLKATVGEEDETGTTNLESGKWYLLHLQTMVGSGVFYDFEDKIYVPIITGYLTIWLGGGKACELEVNGNIEGTSGEIVPKIELLGMADDGFDEIRNLERETYDKERHEYALFLKKSRVNGKSQGALGDPGW